MKLHLIICCLGTRIILDTNIILFLNTFKHYYFLNTANAYAFYEKYSK